MATNAQLTDEYLQIIADLNGDVEGRKIAAEYMENSTAIVHHQHVACSYLPRLFNRETYDIMKETSETAHRILCKVIQRYLDDPAYREVFDFDPRLVELILLPRGYDDLLPFARVDTFLNEETGEVRFCEFNGDGSSGMNENREITLSVARTPAFKEFIAHGHRIEACELFGNWIHRFIDIYERSENCVAHPHFAICDYLENGVVDEFHLFADQFTRKGYPCMVADVRELQFDGETLTDSKGNRIDAIWRRCVTNDVIEYWDESQQLINAVRAGKVTLIGSFAGHVVHDKQIFSALYDPRTQAFLTEEENEFVKRTVPLTTFLDSEHIDLTEVRANKDAWIIKPTDAYGAQDVYAGCAQTQQRWEELVDQFANGAAGHPFIVQSYITPFKTLTLPPEGTADLEAGKTEAIPELYNNLNGLYLYNGQFMGVFSRLGPLPTISKDMKGITAATIWVDCGSIFAPEPPASVVAAGAGTQGCGCDGSCC